MAKTARKTAENPLDNVSESPKLEEIAPDHPSEQETLNLGSEPEPQKPEAEPEPKRRGRPTKDGQPRLLNIIEQINQFESWDGIQAYIYRHEPISNKPGNHMLKRYTRPFDEDDVMQDKGMGSGVYGIIVNRTDPQTRVRRMITSGEITIMNMEYPPRMPLAHWVDDPRNKEWDWAKVILEREEKEKTAPPPPPPPPDNGAGQLVDILREELRNAREEARTARADQGKKNPEEESVMKTLVARAFEPPKTDPVLAAILDKLASKASPLESLALQLLQKQLIDPPKPEAPAPAAPVPTAIEALTQQIELDKKIKENYGGESEGSKASRLSGTQELIRDLTTALAPSLAPVFQILANGMMHQQNLAAEEARLKMHAARAQQPQTPQPDGLKEVIITPQPMPQAGPQLVPDPHLQKFAGIVLTHLHANWNGGDLGDKYYNDFGELQFNAMRTQGKDKILADLNTVPRFAEDTASYAAALNELLDGFILWEPADDDDEEEEDKPEAPPIWKPKTQPTEATAK
jgi:hypothetical protein